MSQDKRNDQAVEELEELRRRVSELENLEVERSQEQKLLAESQVNRRKSFAIVLTSLPALIGVCLMTINTEYIGMMILSCESRAVSSAVCVQPFGWILLGLAVLLTSVALFIVLRTPVMQNEYWWIGLTLLMLFCILPALAILLLGPAALILLESGLT